MARVKLLFASSASGSAGGLTYQSFSSGRSLLRSKSVPSKSKSSKQCINQSFFSAIQRNYLNITQRDLALLRANPYNISANNAYIKLMMPLQIALQSLGFAHEYPKLDQNPFVYSPTFLDVIEPAIGKTGFRLTIQYTPNATTFVIFRLSPAQSLSKNVYYGSFISPPTLVRVHTGTSKTNIGFFNLLPDRSYFVEITSIRYNTRPLPGLRLLKVGVPLVVRAVSISL